MSPRARSGHRLWAPITFHAGLNIGDMLEARAYRSLWPSRFVPCVDAAASPLAQDAAAFSALPPREPYQLFGVEEIAADELDDQPQVSLP